MKSLVLKGNNENLVAFLRDGLSKLWLCPAGWSWKPILKRAHIRWPNKVYAIDLLSEINLTIFKLSEDADAFALLQRDAGKIEGFEWRWKQPKVKSSCSSIFLIIFLFTCFVYIINYLLLCILVRFFGTFNLYSRWLFVTEEDIKAIPCFHVSCITSNSLFYDGLVVSIKLLVPFLFQNETLIAIKAPHGTTLEVPDPDEVSQEPIFVSEGTCSLFLFTLVQFWFSFNIHQAVDYPQRRYRIILRSTMGPIDVYLVRYCFLLFVDEITTYVYGLSSIWIGPACFACWMGYPVVFIYFFICVYYLILVNLRRSLRI